MSLRIPFSFKNKTEEKLKSAEIECEGMMKRRRRSLVGTKGKRGKKKGKKREHQEQERS